jgi:hypothetical protein
MNSSRYFVFPVVLFAGTVLEAQPKGEVAIDMVVIQVDTGYKQSLSVSTAERAADRVGLFSALVTDPKAQVLSRSQVHLSDSNNGQLELGRASLTARPTVSIEMTPEVQNKEELVLHVQLVFQREMQYVSPGGRSQPVIVQRRRTVNIRLRDGQMNVLDGSSADPETGKGVTDLSLLDTPSEELMISFTPHIVLSH